MPRKRVHANVCVVKWIKCMWECHPGAVLKLKNMLIMDSFHGNVTDYVKKRLWEDKHTKFFSGRLD